MDIFDFVILIFMLTYMRIATRYMQKSKNPKNLRDVASYWFLWSIESLKG